MTKKRTSKHGRLKDEEGREDRSESREIADSVSFDHPELHTGHTSRQQKVTAAVAYLLGNSYTKSAKIAGISKPTIFAWKHQTEWWPELISHLKRHHDEDLEARTSGILNRALSEIEDRLLNGEEVVDTKNDKIVRKKVGARDAAITFGTLYDKRQLMRSQPTSISENTSEAARIERLKQQFEELAEKKVNAIEGEFEEVAYDDRNGELRQGPSGEAEEVRQEEET